MSSQGLREDAVRLETSTLLHWKGDGLDGVAIVIDVSLHGIGCRHYQARGTESESSAFTEGAVGEASFILPTGRIDAECKVRWISTEGMGLEFVRLPPESAAKLQRYCESPW